MATYYVGPGGNDGSNGLSWAQRKLTLNGAEDVPVVAGDTVYIGPSVYRELLTLDVSGAGGSPITYVGDVLGEHTDGIGGIVRVTGSDDDQSATRANCIGGTTRSYRTFRGFTFDTCTSHLVTGGADTRTNWIIEDCSFAASANVLSAVYLAGASQANWTIRRCVFNAAHRTIYQIVFTHAAGVDNTGHIVENCAMIGGPTGIGVRTIRVGGITVRHCTIQHCSTGITVSTALTAGQTVTVNNCIIQACSTGVSATALGEIVEDYNTFFGNNADRSTVNVGANSLTYPALFDLGLLHSGASQVSGYYLPQPRFGKLMDAYSQVGRIADTGAATEDIAGVSRPATAGKRSWGAVQVRRGLAESGTVHAGTYSLGFSDAGRHQFKVPCTNVATTVSVYCYREADYAGTNPQMIIKQPGQADRTTTDAAAASQWNQLTDTFTPAATPGWFVVELVSNNTDAANPATNDAFFDDLTVSVNSTLGQMETWLWDSQVADWVQNVPAGGGMLQANKRGNRQ